MGRGEMTGDQRPGTGGVRQGAASTTATGRIDSECRLLTPSAMRLDAILYEKQESG